jgi:hypothetical protein
MIARVFRQGGEGIAGLSAAIPGLWIVTSPATGTYLTRGAGGLGRPTPDADQVCSGACT